MMWYVIVDGFPYSRKLKEILKSCRTGPLQEWTIVDRLSKIQVQTSVANGGENNITKDYVIWPLLDGIPNVQHHKFEGSTHTPFLEERPAYIEGCRKILGFSSFRVGSHTKP